MSSLKEIKGRIASVSSTLKITSAMKMVSSARLRKVQSVIAGHELYKSALLDMLQPLSGYLTGSSFAAGCSDSKVAMHSCRLPLSEENDDFAEAEGGHLGKIAVVAFASNTSLCGAFNSNVIKALNKELDALLASGREFIVFPVGEKIAKAARKEGWQTDCTYSAFAGKATFQDASALAEHLMSGFLSGEFAGVRLLYTRFVSASRQQVTMEEFLPVASVPCGCSSSNVVSGEAAGQNRSMSEEYIIEPSKRSIAEKLLPLALHTQIYSAFLSSSASEHAARMIAMQTATDNAADLLSDLQLTYNKQRQQAITEELTDISNGKLV